MLYNHSESEILVIIAVSRIRTGEFFLARGGAEKEKPTSAYLSVDIGAVDRIRTGDLVLTKDVLCLLSHNSI
jgi:hypothetical protein